MNESEAEILYQLLRDGLPQRAHADESRVGFPAAIENEIAAGKQVRVQLSVANEERIDDPLAGSRTKSTRSRAQFVQQRDFASIEKVAIMLEGIELARIAPVRMADEIFKRIRQLSPNSALTLGFANDHADIPVREVSAKDVTIALPATQRLARAFNAIRAELGPDAALLPDVL